MRGETLSHFQILACFKNTDDHGGRRNINWMSLDVFHGRATQKAKAILGDPQHPLQAESRLLPSEGRFTKSSRAISNIRSFIPSAWTLLPSRLHGIVWLWLDCIVLISLPLFHEEIHGSYYTMHVFMYSDVVYGLCELRLQTKLPLRDIKDDLVLKTV